ncbi:tetratricopeptide repeat protein [Hydrocarboniphaga sp.]|uniref:tetratricopeptide repeat protein n=1 Tax=Hydrocarboniphaga sp. TaxID=2033016 RepID=UPI003D0CC4A0
MRVKHNTRSLFVAGLGLAAALALPAALAQADTAPLPATPATLELPAELINEALAIDQGARSQLDAAQPADSARTTLYVDNQQPRLLLLQMTVQIDTDKPIRYTYGEGEGLALQTDAVQRLAEVAIAPGQHTLYAEYVARYPEDRPGTPRLRSRINQSFEQPAGASAMEISLAPQGWAREPAVKLRQWTPAPGGLDSAELHAIDLLLSTGRELAAASDLLALQTRSGGSLPADFAQRLARATGALRSPALAAPQGNSALVGEYQAAAASGDVAALERIGKDSKTTDTEALALRDEANTALGYKLLDEQFGAAADAAFRRVRSPGPYSETALLGLGWAQLVPAKGAAASAAPQAAGAVKTSIGNSPSPFSSSWVVADEDQADQLRRALVPWTELIGRDPTEAAVQEGSLAIPYALDHLGAHKQAVTYTERAIDQLEHTRTHLEGALTHISSGRMAQLVVDRDDEPGNGWAWWFVALPEPRWWLTAPPNAPDNFYVERLFDNDAFRSQLQNCHRLYELDRLLLRRGAQIGDRDPALSARIAALRPRIAQLATTQRQLLARIATEQVQMLKKQTEQYLVEAHFAMARFNDRPPNAIGNAPAVGKKSK